MKLKLISHELPKSLMKLENNKDLKDSINDYSFVLLHRYVGDKEYAKLVDDYQGFKILDNSCYELGESMSNKILYDGFLNVNPDLVIAPDVLGNKEETINRSIDFMRDYPGLYEDGKIMLITQGEDFQSFIECYKFLSGFKKASLGIPFCFKWVEDDPKKQSDERIRLLRYMSNGGIISLNSRHHLLGTWAASEFREYRDYDWVSTLDTSNPIAGAIDGDRYGDDGLCGKPAAKFDEFIDLPLEEINMELIKYNVAKFREIVNGK